MLIAARNEADRLAETIDALRAALPGAHVVVADDASTDDTPHVALQAGAELVRAPRRLGKGGTATLGAQRLLKERWPRSQAEPDAGAIVRSAGEQEQSEPPLVLLADGDLGASAGKLAELVRAVERGEGDIAVAVFARRVGGGFGFALGAASRVIRRRTGEQPVAPLSGQRAIAPHALEHLVPFARGFGMETGMALDAHRAGLRTVEVELDLEHRATGRTAAGFRHRARQLADIVRVYVSRR